ncbi:hypothetical protein BO79DRAFT_161584 [Aspergillus costaricaensis CBS 115574]|uniref:Uncharacterized protein n=1 Tax=Aspergillus costaricaensis CBS 115574 TaxID=1448317 RepID=A0ACD1HZG7_9EURO|nr:hypothetical protein BO79DRAFT_161584 [Aspergillus costaricaensis CBS 115574]RAK83153.1 hypothetical protein BO79DRAFT_161584 [Aspergillus costaricaensis CBS 115574]
MARGNQRDQSRAKNEKKKQELLKSQKKAVGKGGILGKKENDADKMRAKQALGM